MNTERWTATSGRRQAASAGRTRPEVAFHLRRTAPFTQKRGGVRHHLLLVLGLLLSDGAPARGADAAAHHASGDSGSMAGLKRELIAGVTEKDFLQLGDKPKTAKLLIVATWSDDNYGMNFNGHSKGGAVYTIPKGWNVEVTFINPGPVPHTLVVIERAAVKKIQVAEPYFKGAAVPKHIQGMSYDRATFAFVADEAGDFAFACGFPTHAMNGHWIALDISEEAKEPILKLGEKPARKAERR